MHSGMEVPGRSAETRHLIHGDHDHLPYKKQPNLQHGSQEISALLAYSRNKERTGRSPLEVRTVNELKCH